MGEWRGGERGRRDGRVEGGYDKGCIISKTINL